MEGNFGGGKIWLIHRKTHLAEENLVTDFTSYVL